MTRLARSFQTLINAGNSPTESYRQLQGGALPRSTSSKIPRMSAESRNIGQLMNSLPPKQRKAVMKELLKEGQDFQLGVHVSRTSGSW
jgi:DNA-directed RNA polymerase specialized sigma24 family protein